MKDYSVAFTNTLGGVFPNTLGVNASGPSATDGTEWVKLFIDDTWGARQDLMVEAGLTPSGNDEAVGSSDFVAALKSLCWFDNLITGLVCSNNVTDSQHDIDISVGKAMDSTNAFLLKLTSGLIKQIDASWAAGTNAGGLFTGTVAADTHYGVFLIRKDSDGSIDVGFDTSPTAANIPVGYTAFRRISWVITDSSSNILGFNAIELAGGAVDVAWDVIITDLSTTANNARQLATITSPVDSIAKIASQLNGPNSNNIWILPTTVTDFAPTPTLNTMEIASTGTNRTSVTENIQIDSSSQVAHRSDITDAAVSIAINTLGYLDSRL